ncbi:nitrate- and nitrite sensing domain-containing protein [Streptosporangium fragile]|uniref:histidine kinase n=1 Tax=Streptosporangium fragile TaxID=46186 RepID=A0ABP6I9Y1_9ACTN
MSTYTVREAGGGLRPGNWRVRSRLVALVLVPTVAAVLLGGVQVLASMSAADDYQRVNDLARLSDRVGALAHELAEERDRTAWFIALGRPESGVRDMRARTDLVDDAAARVRESGVLLGGQVGGRTGDEVETVLARLEDLAPLRRQALQSTLSPDAAVAAYSPIIADLLSLHDELGRGAADDVLVSRALTLDALVRAKEALSYQRALLTVALVAGRFEREQLEQFLGALAVERAERERFAAGTGSEERRVFDETVDGRAAGRAGSLRELALRRAAAGASLKGLDPAAGNDAGQWYEAATAVIDQMRGVEKRHAQDIVVRSQELRDGERTRALLVAGAVTGLLLIVPTITTGVARSLVRPLRLLRREALDVAEERLPSYVRRVRESRGGEVVAGIPPIGIVSRDEIGEVARAFDEVHREAVRLAGEEARLRDTVNAMFVSLSRRSQALVERQLTLVERLGRGERDDRRLADLRALDHLATRMRRNSENLLVLAGQEAARRRQRPVELTEVIRVALSEVEDHDRVTIRAGSGAAVAGPAVGDVVHLLAELVENAVSFSPKGTPVTVSGDRVDGGVMVAVTDQGIGMTPGELAEANRRLADPQVADASVARRIGLFVVGRLALRHGIRVRLHPRETGLTAMVTLPESLLVAASAMPVAPPRAPVLAAPVAPEASPAPLWNRPPGTTGPSVWSPPPERPRPTGERSAFPPPGPLDRLPGSTGANETGPPPRAGTSPPGEDDYLPIFASVESGWFRISGSAPASAADTGVPSSDPARFSGSGASAAPGSGGPAASGVAPVGRPAGPGSWSSPGDGGWRAAQAASIPALGGTIAAGLPKRTPRANLVPGSVSPSRPQPPVRPRPADASRSAERARSRMTSFQEGVRKARDEIPDRER